MTSVILYDKLLVMKKITDIQFKVLDYISKNLKTIPPSYSEIMNGVGLNNKQAVWLRVQALKKKGYLNERGMPIITSSSGVSTHPSTSPSTRQMTKKEIRNSFIKEG